MTPCIEAKGWRDKDGYVWIWCDGRKFLAHRVAYCDHHKLPFWRIAGKIVRHACDNRACVNGDHLLLGSHADNAQDKVSRNRQPKGEQIPSAVLTETDVRQIRENLERGVSIATCAWNWAVSHTTISRIKRGITWRHVQ